MSTNMCGICHKSSSNTIRCSFMECQIPFSGTNSVVQTNVLLLLHSALASNTLDIRGLLNISRYMWCHMDVSVSEHWFQAGAFLVLTIADRLLDRHLLTFCGSEGSNDIVLCSI